MTRTTWGKYRWYHGKQKKILMSKLRVPRGPVEISFAVCLAGCPTICTVWVGITFTPVLFICLFILSRYLPMYRAENDYTTKVLKNYDLVDIYDHILDNIIDRLPWTFTWYVHDDVYFGWQRQLSFWSLQSQMSIATNSVPSNGDFLKLNAYFFQLYITHCYFSNNLDTTSEQNCICSHSMKESAV